MLFRIEIPKINDAKWKSASSDLDKIPYNLFACSAWYAK